MVRSRGTSNSAVRSGAPTRRARKAWLFDTYGWVDLATRERRAECSFHCGTVLTWETAEVDRIVPGALGGRYVRANCRLACGPCNRRKGHETRAWLREVTNWTAPRHRRGCRHCQMVRDYRLARAAAEALREQATYGYATEEAEYGHIITFKDWLIAHRGINAEPVAA